jgi:hypothetical protein
MIRILYFSMLVAAALAQSPGGSSIPSDPEIHKVLQERIDVAHQGVGIVVGANSTQVCNGADRERLMAYPEVILTKPWFFLARDTSAIVVSSNERAVRLWKSFGFEIAGRLPEALLHPIAGYTDAYVMYRAL